MGGTQERLAADDDDLVVSCDLRRGAEEVFQLLAGHGCREVLSRTSRQICQRSLG